MRKNRLYVNIITLNLVCNLKSVCNNLRMARIECSHLLSRLKILLLGIEHSANILCRTAGVDANENLMNRTVLFVHKVTVIGGYTLDTQLL